MSVLARSEVIRLRGIGRKRLEALNEDHSKTLSKKLQSLEVKLYNEAFYYLQEHSGEFKHVYNEYMGHAEALLRSDFDGDTYLAALARGRLTARDIRKHPSVRVVPTFNPRELARAHLAKVLLESFDAERATELAGRIEAAMFERVTAHCKASSHMYQARWDNELFFGRYKDRLSIVLNHIVPDTITNKLHGAEALEKLKSGALAPEALAVMEDTELCPKAIERERAEIADRNKQRVVEKFSTLFQCRICKDRRCSIREVQTRSLDEAADFFCTCLTCGNVFKGKT
jgi:DNA-directed RNA polymerase subunit M/transcription elongation factor TFIIS